MPVCRRPAPLFCHSPARRTLCTFRPFFLSCHSLTRQLGGGSAFRASTLATSFRPPSRDPGRPCVGYCTAVLFPPLETLHARSLPCGFVRNPRPDVAVRWIVRPRLIRRPAGQRGARPKFILSEAGGKFMNFSVRRASMSGSRRIQRRHSVLPFFCG